MKNPQLDQLLGTYYHQDFDLDGGLWAALDRYLADSTRTEVEALRQELEAVLSTSSEAEVEALLDEIHCAVYMGDEPGGYRGWLEEIARRVEANL